jgi:Holliday junction resolvase
MSNTNYNRGVRWERAVKAAYEAKGYTVLRTAGSHGFADLVAIQPYKPVRVLQCKCLKTGTIAQAERIVQKFLAAPPFPHNGFFAQGICVYAMKDKYETEGFC